MSVIVDGVGTDFLREGDLDMFDGFLLMCVIVEHALVWVKKGAEKFFQKMENLKSDLVWNGFTL